MIDEAKLATYQNVTLCDVHEDTWKDLLDTMAKLWIVARASEKLIYAPRSEYAPNSKKAVLKAALDRLNEKPAEVFVPPAPEAPAEIPVEPVPEEVQP